MILLNADAWPESLGGDQPPAVVQLQQAATRRRIDWDAVKRRVSENQAALEPGGQAAGDARLEEVRRERARQLAARRATPAAAADTWPALVFTLGTHRLCLALEVLIEVLPCARCAALPGAPPELLGVINVRGRICSVLDLARLLEMPAAEGPAGGYIVLMRLGEIEVGLRVDQVELIEPVSLSTSTVAGGMAIGQYVLGLTGDRLGVLDPQKILSHPVLKPGVLP
jgi:purine-binding chemotaxis protein CheW